MNREATALNTLKRNCIETIKNILHTTQGKDVDFCFLRKGMWSIIISDAEYFSFTFGGDLKRSIEHNIDMYLLSLEG